MLYFTSQFLCPSRFSWFSCPPASPTHSKKSPSYHYPPSHHLIPWLPQPLPGMGVIVPKDLHQTRCSKSTSSPYVHVGSYRSSGFPSGCPAGPGNKTEACKGVNSLCAHFDVCASGYGKWCSFPSSLEASHVTKQWALFLVRLCISPTHPIAIAYSHLHSFPHSCSPRIAPPKYENVHFASASNF